MNLLKIKNLKLKIISSLLIYTIYSILYTPTAHAESFSLGIYPPVITITSQAPSTIHEPISITNFSDTAVPLTVVLKAFTAAPSENGKVEYTTSSPSLFGHVSIQDNDKPLTSFTLAPFQKKDLFLHIALPENQESGDHYFSVIFVSDYSNSDQKEFSGGTNAAAGISLNVLLSINPEEARVQIEEFTTNFYHEKGPVPFTVRVRNTGKNLITPTGTILITNMFNQTIGKVDLLPVNILAGTVRALPDSFQNPESTPSARLTPSSLPTEVPQAYWQEGVLFGPYSATLTIVGSDKGPILSQTIRFVAFPSTFLMGVVIAFLLLLFIRKRVMQKLKQ